MDSNWFKDLFINEAKTALSGRGIGVSSGDGGSQSDCIAGVEMSIVELLPNTSFEGFAYMEEVGCYALLLGRELAEVWDKIKNEMGINDDSITVAELPVVVEIDNVVTKTIARYVYDEAFGARNMWIGNESMIRPDKENTGESFVIMMDGGYAAAICVANEGDSHNIRLYGEKEIVRTIEDKFLPETVVTEDEVVSKITEYNDSQGLPYAEFGEIEILPEMIVYANDEITYVETNHTLVVGQQYEVSINHVVYKVVAKEIDETSMYSGTVYLGDDGGVETGVWGDSPEFGWCVYVINSRFGIKLWPNAFSGGTYVSVRTQGEIVHPIDLKFLPGVCLPVVELSTVVAINATFDDEESAALTAAFESGLPIAIKCNIDTGSFVFNNCGVLAMTTETNGIRGIAWELAETTIQIAFANGKWAVISAS